jgi:uncharacterized protein (AIM24 family)
MTDIPVTTYTYQCHWCRSMSDGLGASCPACGAPVKIKNVVASSSGWEKLPEIPDMARIQFGRSRVQIEGNFVPVADFTLDASDGIYFSHHSILWKDDATKLDAMPMDGTLTRMRAGLPLILAQATGPGRIALSEDRPGEVIAVPIHRGTAVDVQEHHFLAATSHVSYAAQQTGVWFQTRKQTSDGTETETHYPIGRYMDSFSAPNDHGLLLLHAGGNAFMRELQAGESILIIPPSLLYKEPSVAMHLHLETPNNQMANNQTGGLGGLLGNVLGGSIARQNRHVLLRLIGPGRVCVQSQYGHFEDQGIAINQISPHTVQNW